MSTVRLPWLIFGIVLALVVMAFTASVKWSTQSWLDIAAYVVSIIAVLGVLMYALRAPRGAVFWRTFRWVFVGILTAQTVVDASQAVTALHSAKLHGMLGPVPGTIPYFTISAIVMGLIIAPQWVAMTRLAKKR